MISTLNDGMQHGGDVSVVEEAKPYQDLNHVHTYSISYNQLINTHLQCENNRCLWMLLMVASVLGKYHKAVKIV